MKYLFILFFIIFQINISGQENQNYCSHLFEKNGRCSWDNIRKENSGNRVNIPLIIGCVDNRRVFQLQECNIISNCRNFLMQHFRRFRNIAGFDSLSGEFSRRFNTMSEMCNGWQDTIKRLERLRTEIGQLRNEAERLRNERDEAVRRVGRILSRLNEEITNILSPNNYPNIEKRTVLRFLPTTTQVNSVLELFNNNLIQLRTQANDILSCCRNPTQYENCSSSIESFNIAVSTISQQYRNVSSLFNIYKKIINDRLVSWNELPDLVTKIEENYDQLQRQVEQLTSCLNNPPPPPPPPPPPNNLVIYTVTFVFLLIGFTFFIYLKTNKEKSDKLGKPK